MEPLLGGATEAAGPTVTGPDLDAEPEVERAERRKPPATEADHAWRSCCSLEMCRSEVRGGCVRPAKGGTGVLFWFVLVSLLVHEGSNTSKCGIGM